MSAGYSVLSKEIQQAFEQMVTYIADMDTGAYILDPVDGGRVVGHYGETHLCAAMLYYAERTGYSEYKEYAMKLLNGVLAHWDEDGKANEHHDDFNNFALALMYRQLRNSDSQTAELLMKRLLSSANSRNHTVNWLPMRAYAELTRYEYTKDSRYLNEAAALLKTVQSAQYADGLFDDLLPKGESFNLQYCVSTAAAVRMIQVDFSDYMDQLPEINLERTMKTLYMLMLPDGDINYMGRGCNQIFAWGPWIYMMKQYPCDALSEVSIEFFSARIGTSRENCSLMLNAYPGKECQLWWDYHHFTVYMAHLMMWFELCMRVKDSEGVRIDKKQLTCPSDSGMQVYKSEKFMTVSFSGRKHYLVEKGPALVALWSRKHGVLYKCGHGPAAGMFSTKRFNLMTGYLFHFGLLEVQENPKRISNRLLRKLYFMFIKPESSVTIKPVFCPVKVEETDTGLELSLQAKKPAKYILACPMFGNAGEQIRVMADGQDTGIKRMGSIVTQYGDTALWTTQIMSACRWSILIKE